MDSETFKASYMVDTNLFCFAPPLAVFLDEYRSRIDLTLAASLILNEVKIALLILPTLLGLRFALFLAFTSSSVNL